MAGTEEEFQEFVSKNRELIEKIMVLQKEGAIEIASAGRSAAHDAMNTADAAKEKAEEFCRLRGVFSAAVVTGRYDLVVQLTLSEDDGLSLLDFFKTELVKIADVLEVETFVVYQSKSFWVPYTV